MVITQHIKYFKGFDLRRLLEDNNNNNNNTEGLWILPKPRRCYEDGWGSWSCPNLGSLHSWAWVCISLSTAVRLVSASFLLARALCPLLHLSPPHVVHLRLLLHSSVFHSIPGEGRKVLLVWKGLSVWNNCGVSFFQIDSSLKVHSCLFYSLLLTFPLKTTELFPGCL